MPPPPSPKNAWPDWTSTLPLFTKVTVTSVGYGDYYPVTSNGRWVAAVLMLGGLVLLGSVAATLSSWLIDHVRSRHGGPGVGGSSSGSR